MKKSSNITLCILAILSALVVVPLVGFAGIKGSAKSHSKRDVITPLTKDQLATKVPHFYCFEYKGEPQPGKRYWLRINNTTWIERYPDGIESTFNVLGHTTVRNIGGTLVVKTTGDPKKTGANNTGGLQAFIPDKGSEVMHHLYRNIGRGDDDWNDLGKMLSVE